jgi:hypothetical protein
MISAYEIETAVLSEIGVGVNVLVPTGVLGQVTIIVGGVDVLAKVFLNWRSSSSTSIARGAKMLCTGAGYFT